MCSGHSSGTGTKHAEGEGHYQEPMHGDKNLRPPISSNGASKPETKERHDLSRGPTPEEVREKVKSCGTWITRSLDKVGPTKVKDHMA